MPLNIFTILIHIYPFTDTSFSVPAFVSSFFFLSLMRVFSLYSELCMCRELCMCMSFNSDFSIPHPVVYYFLTGHHPTLTKFQMILISSPSQLSKVMTLSSSYLSLESWHLLFISLSYCFFFTLTNSSSCSLVLLLPRYTLCRFVDAGKCERAGSM